MENVIHRRVIVDKSAKLETPVRLARFVKIDANCSVGRLSYISDFSYLASDSHVGRFCSIARFVEIGVFDHPMHFLSTHPFQYSHGHFTGQPEWEAITRVPLERPRGPQIGNDVWIGTKVTILRGVTVGDGSVIAAGSVVKDDVPPYAIVAGAPAKIIKYRFPPDIIDRLLASRWWNRPLEEISHLPFDNIEQALDLLEAMAPLPVDPE
ncbi:CatB-related O-acetyltransferase [Marimonas lutisalis]|uniref:CatB-related O-acetyltransferase n=1 Tax=Marimonas lutisalis TaxID=2545756 RepID=UPI0010F8DAAF|nr:CatB-related O-acetyltransferase [Marimonas lutisalis]